jgi:anti-sigma B factor antagonist
MSEPSPLSDYFRLEYRDGVTVVHFVDIQISPSAKDLLYDLVDEEGHTHLLLNFDNIAALSSHGHGILATLQKKINSAGGHLKLCGLNPDMRQLLHVTKFDRILSFDGNQEEALRDFGT